MIVETESGNTVTIVDFNGLPDIFTKPFSRMDIFTNTFLFNEVFLITSITSRLVDEIDS